MTTKQSALILLFCAIGIVLSWIGPRFIGAYHDAWGMSITAEFKARNLIDERKLTELRLEPGQEDFSIEGRIRNSRVFREYVTELSLLLIVVFLCIASVALLPLLERFMPASLIDSLRSNSD